MGNTFLELLEGDYTSDSILVSLKSAVPVFIAYPEIIIPHGFKLADVMPYYLPEEDYMDFEKDVLLPSGKSPIFLISMFAKVFEAILSDLISESSQVDSIPKVSLQVDIGGSQSHFEVIEPTIHGVRNFESRKASLGTFKGKAQAKDLGSLTEEQKHNILFLDDLLTKCRNTSVGGIR